MGIDCKTSRGLGETETQLLEGAHGIVCASGPGGRSSDPGGRLNQTYLLVLEGLLQRRGLALFHRRDKDTGSGGSGKYSLA